MRKTSFNYDKAGFLFLTTSFGLLVPTIRNVLPPQVAINGLLKRN